MERSAPAATLYFGFRISRLGQSRLRGDRNEDIQYGVDLFDSSQAGVRQLDGRDLLLTDQHRSFTNAQLRQITICALAPRYFGHDTQRPHGAYQRRRNERPS